MAGMTDIVERLAMLAVFNPPCAISEAMEEGADEITRLRAALKEIVAMRPPIPEDAEGNGPNWEQYIYTQVWALFAASLQDAARAALGPVLRLEVSNDTV